MQESLQIGPARPPRFSAAPPPSRPEAEGGPPERCGGCEAPPAAAPRQTLEDSSPNKELGFPGPAPAPSPGDTSLRSGVGAAGGGGEGALSLWGLATGADRGEGYLGADSDPHHALDPASVSPATG